MVRVIVCKPGEIAAVEEIDDSLESMQQLVGGMIEEYQPFYDAQDSRVEDVTIYCNAYPYEMCSEDKPCL